MKLWSLRNPFDYSFAQASLRMRDENNRDTAQCQSCNSSRTDYKKPLLFTWEPGSLEIGDFVWPGLGTVAVREIVFKSLISTFRSLRCGDVTIVEDKDFLDDALSKGKPRISIPYKGPALCELQNTQWVHMDKDRTTASIKKECEVCGSKTYELDGHEHYKLAPDFESGEIIRSRIPREAGKGLFIKPAEMKNNDLVRVFEFPGLIICSTKLKEEIQATSLTNISFSEIGEVN